MSMTRRTDTCPAEGRLIWDIVGLTIGIFGLSLFMLF